VEALDSMLASLLPGLRELRAPLTSGVLTIFSLALFFGDAFDSVATNGGRSDNLTRVVDWIGRPGLVAAALLAAYLIGTMLNGVVRNGSKLLNAMAIDEYYGLAVYLTLFAPYSKDALQSLVYGLHRELNRDQVESIVHGVRIGTESPGRYLAEEGAAIVIASEALEGGTGIRRLRGRSPDRYDDYDRKLAEAELRDGLIVPVPLALIALALNTKLSGVAEVMIGIVGAVVMGFLFLQARTLDREANDVVLYAVLDKLIATPTLERLGWTVH
jgi:hypothetical protein